MAKQEKAQEAQAETIEAGEFESLLKKAFKPKSDQAKDAVTNLSLSIRGRLDRRFFRRARKELANVLEHSSACVTLRIEALHDTQQKHLRRLILRMTRYGDRVSITLREELARIIEVDSSVFYLVLE